jgi:hypothetical protein
LEILGRLAKQVLSQLSYTPTMVDELILGQVASFRIRILHEIVTPSEHEFDIVFVPDYRQLADWSVRKVAGNPVEGHLDGTARPNSFLRRAISDSIKIRFN